MIDYIEDFRDKKHIKTLAKAIKKELKTPLHVMEVCGGHTHTIMRCALDDLQIAAQNPNKNVIFFAIGFETTTPMSALLVQKMEAKNIKNPTSHANAPKF